MPKSILCCAAALALVIAAAPAGAEQAPKGRQMSRPAPAPAGEDCATRIGKLESSQAEGAERLEEKNEVMPCTR